MSMSLTGTVVRSQLGLGAWAFNADDGKTYEIYQQTAPADLLKDGLKVALTGRVRSDVMTMAMIGPVLDVDKFEVRG